MNDIINDEFPTLIPTLIKIEQYFFDSEIKMAIVNEKREQQQITFDAYGTQEKQTIMKRIDPETGSVLCFEIYQSDMVSSMIQFLADQRFGDPRDDTKLELKLNSIPPELFKIPFIQHTNCYKFSIQKKESFMDFFEQVDPTKEIHTTSCSPDMQDIFFSSTAFEKLKNIHLHNPINISAEQFVASQAENIYFRIYHKIFDIQINLKLKKWLEDVTVEYKTIKIGDIQVNWDAILKDIPVVDQVENDGTTEYVIQRSDGTVGRLWCKEAVFQFVNEGKTDMIVVKETQEPGISVILPESIFYKIATFFDLKTQRRFAQTCRQATEIAMKSNRVWPIYVGLTSTSVQIAYDGSKIVEVHFNRDSDGNCVMIKRSNREEFRKIMREVDATTDLNKVLNGYLMKQLKYLTNEKPHHTTVCFGRSWPVHLPSLKYFETADRFEIFRSLTLSIHFETFLENFDVTKEFVIKDDFSDYPTFDQQFFENCKLLKHLEVDCPCEMGHAQFLDSEAEILQIHQDTILEAAINRKMKKWLNEEQNIKYFGIIFRREKNDFSKEEVLNGIQHIETPFVGTFPEPIEQHTITRNDGKEASLFISNRRIVFKTYDLQWPLISRDHRHT